MERYFGEKTPKLGFGLMRLPMLGEEIDIEQTKKMVDMFMEAGQTYFDTAYVYGKDGASEKAIKKALVDRYPRESFTLATKLNAWLRCDNEEMAKQQFYTSLERTGAGYFDYYLLHALEEDNYEKYDGFHLWDFLKELKEKGLVRHAGFSFHGKPELLDRLLTEHPDMEFVQLQLNYADWENPDVCSRACYEMARKHGKSVVVMEPVKGGTLAKVPAAAEELFRGYDSTKSVPSWAIRFAASQPGVMLVLSGMSSLAQMQDNLSYMKEFVPLTEEETAMCFRAAEIINSQTAIPCTACHYCTEGCPMQICIPEYFSIYNEDMREDLEEKGWTINFTNYEILNKKFGKASACIACGQCEGVCPQHLPIIRYLQDVAAHYE